MVNKSLKRGGDSCQRSRREERLCNVWMMIGSRCGKLSDLPVSVFKRLRLIFGLPKVVVRSSGIESTAEKESIDLVNRLTKRW